MEEKFVPKLRKDVVLAVQALAEGRADELQQKLVLKYILVDICKEEDCTYVSGSDCDSAYLQGRRSVAVLLKDNMKIDVSKLNERGEIV